MKKKEKHDPKLVALAGELAKHMKTESDISSLSQLLTKLTVETALGAEMEEHLGYGRHERSNAENYRNGHSSKRLIGDHGEVDIIVPRDRHSTFEPQLIQKGQSRLTHFDDQIIALYSKGMSTRDIVAAFKEMYDAEVSASLVSKVTEAVIERVIEWQNRPLDELYPIVYMDCIRVKVRQDKRVINKAVFIALGINLNGEKEVLGLWIQENEGAKFWLSVLTELKTRGVQDIFIACVDGLTGFPDAISAVFPQTKVQLCIVHMVRNSLRFVSWKERKEVAADLRKIYRSISVEEAEQELNAFAARWDDKFPTISQMWRRHWDNLITLFEYPDDIRKAIYTTNAIESLNRVVRKALKNRKVCPTDTSAMKVVYLAIESASKKWTMPIHNWKAALNRFMIEFPDRMPEKF
ncbi:MAG: IS256 family transposase [Mariprofundaceae bacterium]